jgi:tRNA 2-thiouridine synthesizing protein A
MSELAFDVELDARGLVCPLPILRTKKSLSQMQAGQVLKIFATDPKAAEDFAVFCRQTGNEWVSSQGEGETFVCWLRRRA